MYARCGLACALTYVRITYTRMRTHAKRKQHDDTSKVLDLTGAIVIQLNVSCDPEGLSCRQDTQLVQSMALLCC